jgi:hypothetical protein
MRQDEKATPVADAQKMLLPKPPVRFSVFKSFVPTWEKNGVMVFSVPESAAAKLLTATEQR